MPTPGAHHRPSRPSRPSRPVAPGTPAVLRAAAELGSVRITDCTPAVALARIAAVAPPVLPGTGDASATMIDPDGVVSAAFASGPEHPLGEGPDTAGQGPAVAAAVGGRPVRIRDTAREHEFPSFSRRARRHGVRWLLAVPLPVPDVCAALAFYGRGPDRLTGDDLLAAASFAEYAAATLGGVLALTAATERAAAIQHSLDARAVLEQAKGMIMAELGCSATEAGEVLLQVSLTTGRPLREVARGRVEAHLR